MVSRGRGASTAARRAAVAWLEANVRLPQGLAAESGPLRLWPYQRAIADALADPELERITLVKPTRVGLHHACSTASSGIAW